MTLCFRLPDAALLNRRPEACGVVRSVMRAPSTSPRPLLAVQCQVNREMATLSSFEGVANGGDCGSAMVGRVIVALLCVHGFLGHVHSRLCRRQLGFPFEG
ncbi:hypothetical protein SHKM778_20560 [Streptomyces sp. KM77-8]|uniref:Uncharacterized protein n=1 Tax=Streptomyces haneummycinicus TaxID=3074435 RepID=A0AAT9HE34_9ACTN